jgi:hypothetical protein
MHTMKRWPAATAAAIGTLALAGGVAQAAVPTVSTGGANGVTFNAATLHGTVNPRGLATTDYFEYGTTRRYGSRTPDTSAGGGSKNVAVKASIGGLTSNTTYHYRIVASNPSGVTSGGDRTFTTRRQPLGLALQANPNPVVFGAGVTVAGQLTGTGNAGKQVVLQQVAFPYTSKFANVGNPVVTDANGAFTFAALALPSTMQLRVQTTDGKVTSPAATVGVAVRVETRVGTYRVTRGHMVRFSGVTHPGRDGAQYAVQKRGRSGQWVTVAGGITHRGSANYSGFSRHVRIRRGGDYRVYVRIVDGNYTSGIGRTIHIRSRR